MTSQLESLHHQKKTGSNSFSPFTDEPSLTVEVGQASEARVVAEDGEKDEQGRDDGMKPDGVSVAEASEIPLVEAIRLVDLHQSEKSCEDELLKNGGAMPGVLTLMRGLVETVVERTKDGLELPEELLQYLAQRVHQGADVGVETKAEQAMAILLQISDQVHQLSKEAKKSACQSLEMPRSSGWPLNLTACVDTSEDLYSAEAALEEWTTTGQAKRQDNDIEVLIESMEIGITVENVLERTIVHLVKEGSTARANGVKAGDLLLEVHGYSTQYLSHYETVEALKRSPRPGRLTFRPLPKLLLDRMRHRMQRLIVAQQPSSPPPPANPRQLALPAHAEGKPAPKLAISMMEVARLGRRALDLGAAAVTEWAARCLIDVLRAYLVSICCTISQADDSDNASSVSRRFTIRPRELSAKRQSQFRVIIATLCAFEQQVVAQYTVMGASDDTESANTNGASFMVPVMVPHKPRMRAIGDLLNMLLGLGPTSQGLDWQAPELEPVASIFIHVMCVLLEADIDLTLQEKIQTAYEAPRDGEHIEQSQPLLRFSLEDEPVLKDGGASAAMVMIVRATYDRLKNDQHDSGDLRHKRLAMVASSGVPIATRLARARTQIARVAACRLCLELYWHASASSRLMIRGIITRALVQSLEPTLRHTAVTVLQRLAQRMARWDLEWIVLLCDTAVSDRDTMVRRGGFEFCLRVLHRLPYLFPTMKGPMNTEDLHLQRCKLVAVLKRLVDDQDASVRHAVAAHCCSLCCLLGGGKFGDQWSTWVVDTLHNFLRDPDGAVRSAALDDVPYIIILLNGFAHNYVYGLDGVRGADSSDELIDVAESTVDSVYQWDEVVLQINCCRDKMSKMAEHGDKADILQALACAHASVNVVKRCLTLLLPALLKLVHEQPIQTRIQVATVAGQVLGHMASDMRWHQGLADTIRNSTHMDGYMKDSTMELSAETNRAAAVDSLEELVSVYLTPLLLPLLIDEKDAVRTALLGEIMGKHLWALTMNTTAHLTRQQTESEEDEQTIGWTPPLSCTSVRPVEQVGSRAEWARSSLEDIRAAVRGVTPVVPEESMKLILISLWDLAGRRDWRTRQLAPRAMLAFALYIRTTALQDEFAQVSLRLMKDHVAAVRVTAVECLCLTALVESDNGHGIVSWRDAVVFPHLETLRRKPNARDRLLALYMVQVLLPLQVFSEANLVGEIIPLLIDASKDSLPNIRLGVARTISILVLVLRTNAAHPDLRSVLSRLGTDGDMDVAYAGGRSVERSLVAS